MTDDELMAAYVAGDAAAFETLYRRYHRRVYGFFARALGDPGAAEDLVQQTFLKLHRARARYRPGFAVGGWIFRIAYNLYRDELRRRMRHPVDSLDPQFDRAEADGREETIWNERAVQVRRALAELPETQREALLVCKYLDLSYEEAAAVIDVDPGALKLRVFRGLRALRERFSPDGEQAGPVSHHATAKPAPS